MLLRKTIRELSTYQSFSLYTGSANECFVYVRDFSFWVYCHQRVKRCFDQASCIFRSSFQLCDIACSGKRSEHTTQAVLINGGVVQHIRQLAFGITNGQCIVCHISFSEHLLVSFTCFLWLGEIIEEVCANQFFTGYASRFYRGFIYVSNFSFGTNRNQWVKSSFDQTA